MSHSSYRSDVTIPHLQRSENRSCDCDQFRQDHAQSHRGHGDDGPPVCVEDGLEDVFLDFLLGLVGNVEEIAQNQQAVVDRVHVLFGGRKVVAEIDDADVVKGGVKYKSLILEPKICLLDKA